METKEKMELVEAVIKLLEALSETDQVLVLKAAAVVLGVNKYL